MDIAPESLDPEGVHAQHMALEHILDHLDDRLRPEGRVIDLADSFDAVVGNELDEDEIAPARHRRRISDHEGLEIGDLHDSPFLSQSGERPCSPGIEEEGPVSGSTAETG